MQTATTTRRLFRKIIRLNRTRFEWALQARGWYDLSARSDDDPIIVGGCGRSGTTLLREILNRHPKVFCGPETSMFGLPFWPGNIAPYWELNERSLRLEVAQHENLVQFAESFFRKHANESGKIRWSDKTPNNVRAIEKILTWFPNARFIHMLRDGRDVACSLRNHPKEKIVNGKLITLNSQNPIDFCARRWLADTSRGLAFRGHPRYLEVRYEDLVADPENEIKRVCHFVKEDFTSLMLDTEVSVTGRLEVGRFINNQRASNEISDKSIGRWKRDLTPEERSEFVNVAGELLVATGYVTDSTWINQ